MTPEQQERLESWKTHFLGSVKAELSLKHEDFYTRPILEFNALVTAIAKRARDGLVREFCLVFPEDLEGLEDDVIQSYFILIVSTLNSVLPLDYPYLVALVYSDETPGVRLCSMRREKIPGSRDIISPNVVPVLHIKNMASGESGGINFSVDSVEYY